jgi:DNA-binding CsgD family transcriptional regulator
MDDGTASELTAREAELIELVARGYTNKEIAERIFLSANTVKAHLKKAFRKCGVRNRVEAAGWWSRRELRTPAVPATERAQPLPGRRRSRLGVLLAGAAVPAALAALAVMAGAGGLAFVSSSSGAPVQHCVAEADAVSTSGELVPADRHGSGRPVARCFDTQAEAISYATGGAASSIEELPRGAK